MTVLIDNEAPGMLHIPYHRIINEVVEGTLDYLNIPFEAEVSVTITDAGTIRSLNKEHRGIDAATDVLSFPLNEFRKPGDFEALADDPDAFNPETGELMLGDIIISIDHAIAQAAEYGHEVVREYAFLIAHSMLHLMGYDHMTEADAADMEQRQEEILTGLGIIR